LFTKITLPGQRQILCSCESFLKHSLTSNTGGTVSDNIKDMDGMTTGKVQCVGGDVSTNDASDHSDDEDANTSQVEPAEQQVSGSELHSARQNATGGTKTAKKRTKIGKARTDLNDDGTTKTAQQLMEEQRLRGEDLGPNSEDKGRLGHYSDPVLAKKFRVKRNTYRARMEGHIRASVKPASDDQLGVWRVYERRTDLAREGRDLNLWMGGGASPPRYLLEDSEQVIQVNE
jgi:hypothetical protein